MWASHGRSRGSAAAELANVPATTMITDAEIHAGLLAGGHTNREIAEILFLSPRTVE